MTQSVHKLDSTLFPSSAPSTEKALFRFQLVLAVSAGFLVCLITPKASVFLALTLPLALLFVFGPSRFTLSIFLVYMAATHQYISPFIIPVLSVELHPRELLLGLLLLHGIVKAAQGRARLTVDPTHAAVLLLALSFAFTAVVGLARQHDPRLLIQECRYPAFLLAYLTFAAVVTPSGLRFYGLLLAGLIVTIAVAAVGFSAYATLTRTAVQLNQTVLGEFMQLHIAGVTLQTVRPNGHLFFEVFLVVSFSLVLARGIRTRTRLLGMAGVILFTAAVLATAMRTAYASALISLAFLLFLTIPNRRIQAMLMILAGASFLLVFALFDDTLRRALGGLFARDLSLQGRLFEMRGAWRAFLAHPLAGNGMGSTFEALGIVQSGTQLAAGPTAYQTIHNIWMHHLLKGGLTGFLLASSGLILIFLRGYLLLPFTRSPLEQALLRAILAAYAGQLIASLAMPRLIYPSGHLFVAMTAGAIFWASSERAGPTCREITHGGRKRTMNDLRLELGMFLRMSLGVNRKLCRYVERYLPQASPNMEELYRTTVLSHANGGTIVDIGGGAACSFTRNTDLTGYCRIVAVDFSSRELARNTDVIDKCLADVSQGLPFREESVDMLVSRSAVEHICDVEKFVKDSCRVLKKSGLCIHFFPCRYAPFALLNRLLPRTVSKRLARFAESDKQESCGFRAFYNCCSPAAFERLLRDSGFRVVSTRLGYYQSGYFDLLLPLFLVSAAYEVIVASLGLRQLCAYVMIVAERRQETNLPRRTVKERNLHG